MKILPLLAALLFPLVALALDPCLVKVRQQGAQKLGPPYYLVEVAVDVLDADGGGRGDGGSLATYHVKVDPTWTGKQKQEAAEAVCISYREEREREAAADAYCDSLDGGWEGVVDAGGDAK